VLLITGLIRTTDVCSLSGVYQMKCKDCPLRYVGQTGCTFRIRHYKHNREILTNGQSSKCSPHILDMAHNYDTLDQTMKILHVERKGQMLNTLENYCTYMATKQILQMNDTYNPIFNIVIKANSNTHNPQHTKPNPFQEPPPPWPHTPPPNTPSLFPPQSWDSKLQTLKHNNLQ
jgi:hypothetical protein